MIDNTYTCYYPSPLGLIQVSFTAQALYSLSFLKGNKVDDNLYRCLDFTDRGLRQMYNLIYDQLNGYFTGNRREFDLPLSLMGTRFQVEVWQQLREIPYSRTRTYGQIARAIGRPGASRAVGMANHQNPLPIIIPCHRVIRQDGEIGGYAGGDWRKRWLLEHEQTKNKGKEGLD